MNMTIFIPLVIGLQLFYWFVARKSSKATKGKEDYFLAGRSVKFFPLAMTFFAAWLGGGAILGAADEAYTIGWPVIFYPLGAALGFILLGSGIGKKMASFPVSTVAELFENIYGSPFLKKVASLLSITSLFMILVAQIMASHKFLISIHLTNPLFFVLFWSVIVIYTVQGGLRAVISTDLVQAIVFSTILLFCAFFLSSNVVIDSIHVQTFGQFSSKLSGWLLMPIFFMFIEQDMGQRCFAGACGKTVSKAAISAGIGVILIGVIPIFFGCAARQLGIEVPPNASVLMVAIETLTNPWVTALAGCAVLAVIISTATSLINAISSNVSNDFKLGTNPRLITSVISILAIVASFYFQNILGLLIQSYELSVSSLLIPVLLGIFRRRGPFISALLAILFGFIGFFLFRLMPIGCPREIASLILSLVGYGCGELIARTSSPALKV